MDSGKHLRNAVSVHPERAILAMKKSFRFLTERKLFYVLVSAPYIDSPALLQRKQIRPQVCLFLV